MCLTFASEKCNLNSGSRKMVGLELCSVGLEHGCGFLFSREMGWDEVFPSQPSATHSSKLAKLLPRHLHVIMWHLFDRVWWRVFHPLLNTCAVHLSVCARARARAHTRASRNTIWLDYFWIIWKKPLCARSKEHTSGLTNSGLWPQSRAFYHLPTQQLRMSLVGSSYPTEPAGHETGSEI